MLINQTDSICLISFVYINAGRNFGFVLNWPSVACSAIYLCYLELKQRMAVSKFLNPDTLQNFPARIFLIAVTICKLFGFINSQSILRHPVNLTMAAWRDMWMNLYIRKNGKYVFRVYILLWCVFCKFLLVVLWENLKFILSKEYKL